MNLPFFLVVESSSGIILFFYDTVESHCMNCNILNLLIMKVNFATVFNPFQFPGISICLGLSIFRFEVNEFIQVCIHFLLRLKTEQKNTTGENALTLSFTVWSRDLNLISDRGDAEVVQVRRRDPDGAGRAEAGGGGAPQQTAGLQGEGSTLQRQVGGGINQQQVLKDRDGQSESAGWSICSDDRLR